MYKANYSKVFVVLFMFNQSVVRLIIRLQPGGLHGWGGRSWSSGGGGGGGGGSGAPPELTGPPQENTRPAAEVSRLTRCEPT